MPVKRDKQYPIRITYCCSQHFYPDLNNNNLSESELDPSPAQTQSHPVLTHISVQFTKLCLKLRRNWSPQQICSHHKIPDIFLQHCHYALDTDPVIFSCHHVIIFRCSQVLVSKMSRVWRAMPRVINMSIIIQDPGQLSINNLCAGVVQENSYALQALALTVIIVDIFCLCYNFVFIRK